MKNCFNLHIGEFTDGKPIIVDKADFTRYEFRVFLHNLLVRDITDETRDRISKALKTPMTKDEFIQQIQYNLPFNTDY